MQTEEPAAVSEPMAAALISAVGRGCDGEEVGEKPNMVWNTVTPLCFAYLRIAVCVRPWLCDAVVLR